VFILLPFESSHEVELLSESYFIFIVPFFVLKTIKPNIMINISNTMSIIDMSYIIFYKGSLLNIAMSIKGSLTITVLTNK